MKHRAILSLVVAIAFALLLPGCGHRNTAARPGQLTLGMVTDVGGLGDKSFNDSAYRGLVHARDALGAHIQVLQSHSAADYQPNLSALTDSHIDMIYAIGFLMNKDLDTIAAANPKQHYAIIDAVVSDPNVVSVTFKEEDGSFLAGALAALVSKTHHVAFLGGQDIPLLRKFEAGFTAGVHQVDPNAKVDVKYVNSFDDVASGKELANVLFSGGADIVYAAAGKAGLGAMDAVSSRANDYVIGVDSNQDALVKGKVLTSVVKHVDVAVFDIAKALKDKRPTSGHIVLGLKQNGVGLTDFQYTRAAIGAANIARIARLKNAIVGGTIVPPSTREELSSWKPVKL
ncbi:MAG: BMP family ABC transporter substrate-binding protein [Candidatus Eremiobacteraeota bacterium]|nr:BMP family ABC transporter substrate-binding protein [Candidatus Eremiobacteraeota bacterium]